MFYNARWLKTSRPTHALCTLKCCTRYMDNAYIALCNVLVHTQTWLRKFVETLHEIVYNTKMKWRPTAVHTDWCDARLFSEPNVNITLKGVPFRNGEPAYTLWGR